MTQIDLNVIDKKNSFVTCAVILFFMSIIPSASAEDLQIDEECLNDTLTLTVLDSDGPMGGVSAYVYKDTAMKKISDKFISDDYGKIKIKFSDQTAMMKIIKESHEHIIKNLECDEEFRAQSVNVFSVMDSSVGIVEDPETKLITAGDAERSSLSTSRPSSRRPTATPARRR